MKRIIFASILSLSFQAFAENPCGVSCTNRLLTELQQQVEQQIEQAKPTPCTQTDRRCGVFVTQMFVDGAMGVLNPAPGYIDGLLVGRDKADAICQFEGERAQPGSQWKAFLSIELPGTSAKDHATQLDISYFRAGTHILIGTGTTLFTETTNGGNDFHLGASIDGSDGHAWTGTTKLGESGPNCTNWTVTAGVANIGNRNQVHGKWVNDDSTLACSNNRPLYCFQQPTA